MARREVRDDRGCDGGAGDAKFGVFGYGRGDERFVGLVGVIGGVGIGDRGGGLVTAPVRVAVVVCCEGERVGRDAVGGLGHTHRLGSDTLMAMLSLRVSRSP